MTHLKPILIGILAIISHIGNSQNSANQYKISSNNQDEIIIPFEMQNRKPLFHLTIDNKDVTMMIDNGVLWDQVWFFGSPIVNALKLFPKGTEKMSDANRSNQTNLYESHNVNMDFGDIIFYEQPVLVSPVQAGFARMFPGVDGQICNTFFKNFIVEFDFEKSIVILHNPNTFKYQGNGSILNMELTESGAYSVPFEIKIDDKVFTDRANIDLGGIYSFKVSLNTIHNIQPPAGAKEKVVFGGTEYFANIQSLKIGKYRIDNPEVVFGDETTARVHPLNLGLIGLPLFLKFNVVFDYFNNRLYLTLNKNFNGVVENANVYDSY